METKFCLYIYCCIGNYNDYHHQPITGPTGAHRDYLAIGIPITILVYFAHNLRNMIKPIKRMMIK